MMEVTLRRRIAVTLFQRIRTSLADFALPGLRKENLEHLPLTVWIGKGKPRGEQSLIPVAGIFELFPFQTYHGLI